MEPRLKVFGIVAGLLILAAGCAPGDYNNDPYGYGGGSGNRGYGYDRYPDYRDDDYYRDRRDRDYDNRYRDRDQYEDDDDDDDDRRPPPRAKNPPPPPRQENVIRPSCPSGTKYNGRHCVITDSRLKKPGGDGNINPCPKGMWVSGDRCVGN